MAGMPSCVGQGVAAFCDSLTGGTARMLSVYVRQAKLPASLTYTVEG